MINRRKFIGQGSTITLGSLALTGVSTAFLSACGNSKVLKTGIIGPTFEQVPLGYAYNALEPYIDAATMEIHYTKHAAGYAKNLKDALAEESVSLKTLPELLGNISKFSTKMRNNAGGHYNHESFWKMMSPGGKPMSDAMTQIVQQNFGSVGDMRQKFGAAASQRFGSGWAWLIMDKNKQLQITSTPNQDNPLMDVAEIKGVPLLGLDVWEHAYYLKYQNKRADYIENWWKVVNWDEVENRYKQAG